jgi:hypothetical protein
MIKKIVAIIALVLVIGTIAGCTTTNNTNQTPSTTSSAATQHDASLENMLTILKGREYANNGLDIKAWDLQWINSTSAHLQWTALVKRSNYTWNYDNTYTVFPTTEDATNYLNALNKTAYVLNSTQPPSGGFYQNATGHAPQIFKQYVWKEGDPSNVSEYRYHQIEQADNFTLVQTQKILSVS